MLQRNRVATTHNNKNPTGDHPVAVNELLVTHLCTLMKGAQVEDPISNVAIIPVTVPKSPKSGATAAITIIVEPKRSR